MLSVSSAFVSCVALLKELLINDSTAPGLSTKSAGGLLTCWTLSVNIFDDGFLVFNKLYIVSNILERFIDSVVSFCSASGVTSG